VERKVRRDIAGPVWGIWPGPGRGYITLEHDMLVIADALEALWLLRARRREMEAILAVSSGGVTFPAIHPEPRRVARVF
jgi:hypothetical protein